MKDLKETIIKVVLTFVGLVTLTPIYGQGISFETIKVSPPAGVLQGNQVAQDGVVTMNWIIIASIVVTVFIFFWKAAKRTDDLKPKEAFYSLGAVGIIAMMVGFFTYLGLSSGS